ncbi:MAG: type II toxin-antitoxin system VapC family toxin [Anaerolineae bacterium]
MNGDYLLDTNIVIALFAREVSVLQGLTKAEGVFIPSIVIGELYYGAYRSGQRDANLARITQFVVDNVVLNCDAETAHHYGAIKDALQRKGRPVPENDLWIAALARQHQLTLVTRDTHFNHIPNLAVESWV